MSITREFSEDERRAAPAILGIRGTGWFLSRQRIVTAAHVAEAMRLSAQDRKAIENRERERWVAIPARISGVAGPRAEKLAMIELQTAFPDAVALRIRMQPLVPEERLLSLAYPGGKVTTDMPGIVNIRQDPFERTRPSTARVSTIRQAAT